MKQKISALLLFALLFSCLPLFAAEIILAPNVGFSIYTVRSAVEVANAGNIEQIKLSKNPVTYTMLAPSIGLDMHFIHERSGFTFSLVNTAGLPVTLHKNGGFGNDKRQIAGAIWDGQMLFGYTYGVKQPLSIRFGIGPGIAVGVFKAAQKQKVYILNPYYLLALPALHFDIQYAFTEHFGINAGIRDMIGFSGILLDDAALNSAKNGIVQSSAVGFGNVFSFKIAAVFRL